MSDRSIAGTGIQLRLTDHQTEYGELRIGSGQASPRTIVLVHSALLDRRLWSVFAERLAAELSGDWRLVAYDLRSHGAARAAPAITGIDQLAEDLRELVGVLGADRVHLVGLSLGGAVVQATALAAPDLVASLTLAGTSSQFPADVMEQRARLSEGGVSAELTETLRRWFSAETFAEDGPVVEYARKLVLDTPEAVWAQTWRALGGFDVDTRLPEITAPVLAVAGEQDTASPPARAARIAEGVADGRLVVVDRAAHLIALERPDVLAAHVASFLRDHESDSDD